MRALLYSKCLAYARHSTEPRVGIPTYILLRNISIYLHTHTTMYRLYFKVFFVWHRVARMLIYILSFCAPSISLLYSCWNSLQISIVSNKLVVFATKSIMSNILWILSGFMKCEITVSMRLSSKRAISNYRIIVNRIVLNFNGFKIKSL